MTITWTNWSGSVRCTPQSIQFPQTEAKIADLVHQAQRANAHVRVAGTGHSFVPLCASDEILISLDGLQGVIERSQGNDVVVWAGTKLHQLGDPLWAMGLALANMGDIDRQALAGAVSTGTHGTGRTLGSISTQVVGLRLVIASGEVIDCSPTQEPEIFKAAQVSLGALGVITQITLRLLPAYQLHEHTWVTPFADCLPQLDKLISSNRHFEFFWAPSEDACAMKALNPILAGAPLPPLQLVERGANGEASKGGVKLTGRLPRYISDDRIDRGYRIFPSERNLKFNEIEFAVPAANGPDCLCEIRQLMQTKHPTVIWPIEYRTLATDDVYLSPAYQRPTVTLSVHQAAELPYQPFFADVEAIFRNHQGRPHWGKIHTHTACDFRSLYPMWARFQAVRQQLDPSGCFTNPYLQPIFT